MTPKEKRIFLQCLFSVAWVDGEISEQENAILAILFNNVGLPPDDREVVNEWFDAPPPEPDWFVAGSDDEMRNTLLQQVVLIAASDGTVDLDEVGLVDRLRQKLGVDDEELSGIVQKVEAILAG